jgi:hypothetical protein
MTNKFKIGDTPDNVPQEELYLYEDIKRLIL